MDDCYCGQPPVAECHQPSDGGCMCRLDRHVYGCHYLPWVAEQDALEVGEDA